uniref:Si:ch211-14a17.10 n=1 Tax=Cyprinus carpio carpio TaxID=630221 RepID=A0A8C1E6L5_CYPCA
RDFKRERRVIEVWLLFNLCLQKDLDNMKIKCRDSYKIAKDNIDLLKILQNVNDLQDMDAILNTERDAAKIEILHMPIYLYLTELKKYLEDKLKQPGEQGDTAKQVLQIVILQIETMELKTRISGKFKTQAQIDVIISKLEFKNGLLSDLKEEREVRKEKIQKIDELTAALEKEILDLNAELSALRQTLVQLDAGLDAKRTEIMDKIAKLKGKDEIISRILKLQFEFMEALITAQGQMKADEFKIDDLQKELKKEQDRALYLDADNKRKIYIYIYIIILLGFEINQITKQIKASSSNDSMSLFFLKVISQMEEIWKLQSEDPDNLNKISDLQKDLMNLISQLDNKMASKPMLKIIALQSDVTWISEMLRTVTTKAEIQKAELQKTLDDIKLLLNEKNKELAAATGDISQLQKDIAALKKEVSRLKVEIDTIEGNANKKIKDLQENLKQSNNALDDANKSLKEKDATLSQQIANISNLLNEVKTLKQQVQEKESLLNARIADLERSLTMKKEENAKINAENEKLKKNCLDNAVCPDLQKKYKGTLSFYLPLIDEVQYLDEQIAQGFPELRQELDEKKRELEKAKQKLQAEGSISAKSESNPILPLQNSGEKGLGLALKIMSIKESMFKLKQAQEQMKQKYAKEINGLQNQIQNKEKEILLLQANCELSDKIQQLEKELKESKQNVKKLQQESKDKIASLEKQIKTKDQQLAKTEEILQNTNAKNAALIKQLNDLNDELKKLKEEKKYALQKLQEEIADLKKKLKNQENALAEKDLYLKEKNGIIDILEKQRDNMKSELEKVKNKNRGQYKVILLWPQLDANTAHRRLVLSQDEKEARTSILPKSVPDTPERYDTAIAALGKDGYDSGKYYWEIGVIGKKCYVVGAAKASAQRKGILTYSPSVGYWVILKDRASKLFAMADKVVQLNADALSVIGVQLDFKNNKVTFYDAERKLEIFSFTGNVLQGKIYPYIETCSYTNLNEPPLIFKQPQSTDWLKQ